MIFTLLETSRALMNCFHTKQKENIRKQKLRPILLSVTKIPFQPLLCWCRKLTMATRINKSTKKLLMSERHFLIHSLIVPIRPLSMRVCAVAKKKTIKRHIRPFIVCVCSLGALSLSCETVHSSYENKRSYWRFRKKMMKYLLGPLVICWKSVWNFTFGNPVWVIG